VRADGTGIDTLRPSSRISAYLRSNVLGLVAIFIALGGTSYAMSHLPRNSVGRKQIKNNAVIGKKVKDASLSGADLADNSVTGQQVSESTLGTVPSATSATTATNATTATTATTADTATNATTATNAMQLGGSPAGAFLQGSAAPAGDLTGTYAAPVIAGGAVNSAKVQNQSVTGTDIANDSLDGTQVQNLSGADIADGSLGQADIGVATGTPTPDFSPSSPIPNGSCGHVSSPVPGVQVGDVLIVNSFSSITPSYRFYPERSSTDLLNGLLCNLSGSTLLTNAGLSYQVLVIR
jgi:hypothetical protein